MEAQAIRNIEIKLVELSLKLHDAISANETMNAEKEPFKDEERHLLSEFTLELPNNLNKLRMLDMSIEEMEKFLDTLRKVSNILNFAINTRIPEIKANINNNIKHDIEDTKYEIADILIAYLEGLRKEKKENIITEVKREFGDDTYGVLSKMEDVAFYFELPAEYRLQIFEKTWVANVKEYNQILSDTTEQTKVSFHIFFAKIIRIIEAEYQRACEKYAETLNLPPDVIA